jgi:hypothetical protein
MPRFVNSQLQQALKRAHGDVAILRRQLSDYLRIQDSLTLSAGQLALICGLKADDRKQIRSLILDRTRNLRPSTVYEQQSFLGGMQ